MSTLKNINLSTLPDITDVQDNFNTLNNDKLEVGNINQGENIQITVDGKNITISSTGGGGTGVDGVSLQYHWNGTSLGIKREDEVLYTYVNLKGQDGIIGVDGKSAYQSWLDLGNIGTEQDFINSMKGENGLDGVDGENGKNIEMRYSETYLQYRLVGDVDWINLIQLTQSEIDLISLTDRVIDLETRQGDLTSVPAVLQNKTIAEMITTNFTSVSNGKGLIANAITDKGILTLATDTFQVMADNIGQISGGGDKFYLYNEGNEYIQITGGWSAAGTYGEGTRSITKETDHLKIQLTRPSSGNAVGNIYCINKIDLTGFTFLCVEVTHTSADNENLRQNASIRVQNDKSTNTSAMAVATLLNGEAGALIRLNANVSNIKSNIDVGIRSFMSLSATQASATLKIYKVWLE